MADIVNGKCDYINKGNWKDCKECADVNNLPYSQCCLFECFEHDFCKGCTKYNQHKHENN